MREIMELFGLLAILFFLVAIANFCLKYPLRTFKGFYKKHPKLAAFQKKLVKPFYKVHKLAGIGAIVFMIVHTILASMTRGWHWSGILVASLFALQMVIGMIGAWAKPKTQAWLVTHRVIALAAILSLIVHGVLMD